MAQSEGVREGILILRSAEVEERGITASVGLSFVVLEQGRWDIEGVVVGVVERFLGCSRMWVVSSACRVLRGRTSPLSRREILVVCGRLLVGWGVGRELEEGRIGRIGFGCPSSRT